MHCQMFSSIAGLYSLEASSTPSTPSPVVTIKNVSWGTETLLVEKRSLESKYYFPHRAVGRVKQDNYEYSNPKPQIIGYAYPHIFPNLSLVLVTAPISGLAGASSSPDQSFMGHYYSLTHVLVLDYFFSGF